MLSIDCLIIGQTLCLQVHQRSSENKRHNSCTAEQVTGKQERGNLLDNKLVKPKPVQHKTSIKSESMALHYPGRSKRCTSCENLSWANFYNLVTRNRWGECASKRTQVVQWFHNWSYPQITYDNAAKDSTWNTV